MIILPTHQCFDDALDLLAEFASSPWPPLDIVLVHGIARQPEDHPFDPGKRFAHAWVEVGGEVWDAGVLDDGRRVRFSVKCAEYYAHLRIEAPTRYTPEEAWLENVRSGMYGPWKPEYLALCRQPPEAHP